MTKNKIAKTFMDLAKTKSVDKITVKDIVEACGVTRQTFYYHFQDIEDVIDWTFTVAMENTLDRCDDMTDIRVATFNLVSDVMSASEIISKLYNSKRHMHVENTIFCTVHSFLGSFGNKLELYAGYSDKETELSLDIYSYAIAGLMLGHMDDSSVDVKMLADTICSLMDGSMAMTLKGNFLKHLSRQ